MYILPSIDLKDGLCVRLRQGDAATTHTVAGDAVETAKWFAADGAEWVHMVDLDGAFSGEGKNLETIENVTKIDHLKVELGGGIRDMFALERAFELGVARAVIGSAAVTNPDFLSAAIKKYGDRIAVGVDALNDEVRISGWTQGSGLYSYDFVKQVAELGVKYIIFTDIGRDGMLSGPPLDTLKRLVMSVDCEIIASGGVSSNRDITLLKGTGVHGAIVGKALYTGDLDLKMAVESCRI